MRFLYLLPASLLLTSATFAQQPAMTHQDPTALGNAFFKAMLDEDATTIGQLLTSDFTITSFDGSTADGALLLQGVGGGYVIIETGTVLDVRTRQYNSNTAVMMGTWKAKGSVQGQSFPDAVTFSITSTKQRNDWKIANVQFTPIR